MARAPKPKAIQMANGDIMWRVQFRVAKGTNPTSERFATKADAERFIQRGLTVGWAAAREERNIGSKSAAKIPSLSAFAHTYFDARPNITPRTRSDYRSTARRSWEQHSIGNLPIDVIKTAHIEAFVTWYQTKGLSRKTVEQSRSLLAQVLQHAVERDLIEKNPAKGVRTRKGQKSQMTFLTPAEFESLMTLCPEEGKPLLSFMFSTGVRIGEATALQWKDIDLASSPAVARISRTWTKDEQGKRVIGPPKTGLSNRTVALAPEVVKMLGKRQDGETYVFETFGQRKGRAIHRQSFYKMIWQPLIKAANDPKVCGECGIPVLGKNPRMHDLRHSHAAYLISQNLPMMIIQRRLGHESIKTTVDTYGHLMPDALLLAAEASSASIRSKVEAEIEREKEDQLERLIEERAEKLVQEKLRRLLES